MTEALPLVNCHFECEAIPASFSVIEAKYTEALCAPFELEVTVKAHALAVHPELMIGHSCHFTFDRKHLLRSVWGMIEEIELVGDAPIHEFKETRKLKIKVVPAFKLLEHRKNSRIFQDMSVLAIVRDVLLGESIAAGGHPEGLTAFARTYEQGAVQDSDYAPNRDYCVQYKESDFAFVSRLLEEEGIAYHFEHMRGDHEVLMLGDTNLTYPQIESLNMAPLLHLLEVTDVEAGEGLEELNWVRKRKEDQTLFRHWDWLNPHSGSESTTRDEEGEGSGHHAQAPGRITSYDHSEERNREENEGHRTQRVHEEGGRRGRLRHQREKVDEWVARGKSNATGISAGRSFEHDGDGVHSLLITSATHHFDATGSEDGRSVGYRNEFEAIPIFRTFRPKKKHKRPKIQGPQTATVTGPEGEEIHTDAHGRIKLLMNWDRDGEGGHRREQRHDASSSVWVRVAQMWAGAGWGSVFLPRVGMEVVVQFLDGNPDKPLVTGCVYNGGHDPPYTLPDEKTKSTIKSNSSPGGDGFNEFRFEDAAGSEQVYLHAQRDHDTEVRRRQTLKVGENQETEIEGDRTRTVAGSETVRIDGNQAVTVHGGGGEGTEGIEVQVTKTYKLSASSDISAVAPDMIELKCQGSFIELTPGKIRLRAGDGAELVLDANVFATSKDGSELKMDDKIRAHADKGAKLDLESKASVEDSGGSSMVIDGSIVLESNQGARCQLDQNILGEGQEVQFSTIAANLHLTAAEALLQAASTQVIGDSMVEIDGSGGRGVFAGGMVQLN